MSKFFSNSKLFLIIIFAAVLMLPFNINNILSHVEFNLNAFSISQVRAQAPANKEIEEVSKANSPRNPIKASMVLAGRQDDPTLFSEKDINILQKLAARRQLIELRSEELKLREGLLGAAEKRIDKKILELKRLIVALKRTIKKKK